MSKSIAAIVCASVLYGATPSGALAANVNNLNVSGSIKLVPSTVTDGNIYKGTAPFLHDYGISNIFLGVSAGNFTMTGSSNTVAGWYAFLSNADGSANTAVGAQTLWSNTSGALNTATGAYALASNTSGANNTAVGANALASNTEGAGNTAVGVQALSGNTAGVYNIAIGTSAGSNLTTGHNNIAIGNAGVAGDTQTLRLGSAQTRAFVAGIRGITTDVADGIPVVIDSAGQLGTLSSSRRTKVDIADMGAASNVLMKLRPVTFHYKTDKNRAMQYGLIAEEVNEVAPNLVARRADGAIETVYYQHLVPMLLNEYQQQQRVIAVQAAQLAEQAERVAVLERQAQDIAALKHELTRLGAALGMGERIDRVAASADAP